jgi:hypothetical protein
MPTTLSTVPNTSDQNYQAMLTTEPVDTANNVDVPADFSTPFYLTSDQLLAASVHTWGDIAS